MSKEKNNINKNISKKLMDSHKDVNHTTTEGHLSDYRSNEEPHSITEKLLDSRRENETAMTTEARLNSQKSKLGNIFRNESAYKGDLPKLEEQRIASKKKEDMTYKSAGEYQPAMKWWDKAKKDNLKLASVQKTAEWEDDEKDFDDEDDEDDVSDFLDFGDEDGVYNNPYEGNAKNIVEDFSSLYQDEIPEEDISDYDVDEMDELEDLDFSDFNDIPQNEGNVILNNNQFQISNRDGTPLLEGKAELILDSSLEGLDIRDLVDLEESKEMILDVINTDERLTVPISVDNVELRIVGDKIIANYSMPLSEDTSVDDMAENFLGDLDEDINIDEIEDDEIEDDEIEDDDIEDDDIEDDDIEDDDIEDDDIEDINDIGEFPVEEFDDEPVAENKTYTLDSLDDYDDEDEDDDPFDL